MRYAITFLVGLLAFCSNAQPLTLAQADSLRRLLRTNEVDTNRVGMLLQLSGYYQSRTLNYQHNLDSALTLANLAQALSQQLRYDIGQQGARFQQGRIFIKQEKLSQLKRLLPDVDALTRIRLLLELGKSKLRATYSQEAKPDSALVVFSQAERLSSRIKNRLWQQESQLLTGVAYVFKDDCPTGKVWFRRVIEARQRAGDQAGELQAWLQWAVTQYSEWKCMDNVDSLSRAFTLARQLGDRPREAFLLIMTDNKYAGESNIRLGMREARQALAIQKAIGYPALNRAYHALLEENQYLERQLLGNFLDVNCLLADLNDGNPNQNLFYNLEVVKDLERSGLREDLDWPYFWLGNMYSDLGQHAKALSYYQQSLAVSHQKKEAVVYVGLIRHLAESLLKVGSVQQAVKLLEGFTSEQLPLNYGEKMSLAIGSGQCYAALHQNQRAEQYYLEAVEWSSKLGDDLARSFAWRYISEFYVTTAQYTKAIPYLNWLEANTQLLNPAFKRRLYLLEFKVDSAQANYPAALGHYQQYTTLKDSLLNETTNKQMAELDIRYQSRQKEQTILLRQKDIRLLTQQNQTQQTQRNALIGGTLLLAALLGLGYNRYRLKQRSNQLLEVKQQQINDKNEALQRVLTEKERLLTEQERLLKEIHHRVKNNLQVVMSLLNSQAASMQDKVALSAIQESQHRVQAMALIHQKLYQSEGIARIPMVDYIAELVAYLHESYDLLQPIGFDLRVEPIELDVTQAVPLGLIINEAVTNALKYAFPGGRSGTVQVALRQVNRTDYELLIADDGVGLPGDFDPVRSRSLGMTLIRGFSEQLDGQLHINSQSGLAIRVLFPDERHTVSF